MSLFNFGTLYGYFGDDERRFIYSSYSDSTTDFGQLYREDFELPEVSADSIENISITKMNSEDFEVLLDSENKSFKRFVNTYLNDSLNSFEFGKLNSIYEKNTEYEVCAKFNNLPLYYSLCCLQIDSYGNTIIFDV